MSRPSVMRLDVRLVALGLAPSRARAQALIRDGAILVDGVVADRPALRVAEGSAISLDAAAPDWVSRGALKLDHALTAFDLAPEGARCVDLGASTGGFTQVLLTRGAAHVTAVDVGRGQLSQRLASDPRVADLSPFDARALTPEHFADGAPRFLTADLAFIGLLKATEAALSLAPSGAILVALVKPQFEVGPAHVGRGGIVKDPAERARAVAEVREGLTARGWRVREPIQSPIAGGDGNVEFLIAGQKA